MRESNKRKENLLALIWVIGIITLVSCGGLIYMNRAKLMKSWSEKVANVTEKMQDVIPSAKTDDHDVILEDAVKKWIKDKFPDPQAELKTLGKKFHGLEVYESDLILGDYRVAVIRTHSQAGGWIFNYRLFWVNNGSEGCQIKPGDFYDVGDAVEILQEAILRNGDGDWKKEFHIKFEFATKAGLDHHTFDELVKLSSPK